MKMSKFEKAIKGLFIAGTFVAAGSVFAATDGLLDTTSEGTVLIEVEVGDQIQISGMIDMIGSYVPGTDYIDDSPACVYRNGGSGNFGVTVSSTQASATSFELEDGPTNAVEYSVTFSDGVSTSTMTNGVPVNTFTNANTTSPTCSNIPQSTIAITVPDANLAAAGPGTYSDTLVVLVAPQ